MPEIWEGGGEARQEFALWRSSCNARDMGRGRGGQAGVCSVAQQLQCQRYGKGERRPGRSLLCGAAAAMPEIWEGGGEARQEFALWRSSCNARDMGRGRGGQAGVCSVVQQLQCQRYGKGERRPGRSLLCGAAARKGASAIHGRRCRHITPRGRAETPLSRPGACGVPGPGHPAQCSVSLSGQHQPFQKAAHDLTAVSSDSLLGAGCSVSSPQRSAQALIQRQAVLGGGVFLSLV
ncbi:unnamed protein product [Eretmochelys imbricata]